MSRRKIEWLRFIKMIIQILYHKLLSNKKNDNKYMKTEKKKD